MTKRHWNRSGDLESLFLRLEELDLANSGEDEFEEREGLCCGATLAPMMKGDVTDRAEWSVDGLLVNGKTASDILVAFRRKDRIVELVTLGWPSEPLCTLARNGTTWSALLCPPPTGKRFFPYASPRASMKKLRTGIFGPPARFTVSGLSMGP